MVNAVTAVNSKPKHSVPGELLLYNQSAVRLDLVSDRALTAIPSYYSVEARTSSGTINYDRKFGRPSNRSGSPGLTANPIEIDVPVDATEFRVTIQIREYSAISTRLQIWLLDKRQNDGPWWCVPAWKLLTSVPQTSVHKLIYSPWIIRSNGKWIERTEGVK
jgi:hypothetical protein